MSQSLRLKYKLIIYIYYGIIPHAVYALVGGGVLYKLDNRIVELHIFYNEIWGFIRSEKG